jgi:hypothetical protein
MIIIKCSWCGTKIGTKECDKNDKNNGKISHGICDKCEKKVYADLDKC